MLSPRVREIARATYSNTLAAQIVAGVRRDPRQNPVVLPNKPTRSLFEGAHKEK